MDAEEGTKVKELEIIVDEGKRKEDDEDDEDAIVEVFSLNDTKFVG